MPIDKGAISAMATIANTSLRTAGVGAGMIAAATQNAFGNVACVSKAAITATGEAANGFINNGINFPSSSTMAVRNLAAIQAVGLHAAGVGAGMVAEATQNAVCNVADGAKAAINAAGGAAVNIINNENLPSKGTVLAVAAGATIAVAGATLFVPAVGFTVAGVKAGTLAAAIHGAIGNVAASSFFASFQSAGVLGLAAGTKVGIGAVGGAAGAFIKNKL